MNIINSEIGDRPSFVGLTPFSENISMYQSSTATATWLTLLQSTKKCNPLLAMAIYIHIYIYVCVCVPFIANND